MMKRTFALLLCLTMFLGLLAGCSSLSGDDKGAYIPMYLNDETFDFDPANAYYNTDSVNVLNLIYEPLFTLSKDGKIKPALAKSYKTFTDDEGNHMDIVIRTTLWNDGSALTANDVVYAWNRLLDPANNFYAASLLFDVKNARAYNRGMTTDLGIAAIEQQKIRITFEDQVNVNSFLLNLTSVATAPLSEYTIQNNPDWAKNNSNLITNGPFKVTKIEFEDELNDFGYSVTVSDDYLFDEKGNRVLDANGEPVVKPSNKAKRIRTFMLERNSNYYRDTTRDALDKYVTPYRILVDCTKTAEEMLEEYKGNQLFYFGSIPLSMRKDTYVAKRAKVSNALSTFVCYLNEELEVNGVKIFSDAHVRRALSLALDRDAIADEIVYAEAATALIGPGVFEKGTSGSFRKAGGQILSPTADLTAAKNEIDNSVLAGKNLSFYRFEISVASYDEVHVRMAELIAEAWTELGFNVSVKELYAIENNDILNQDGEKVTKTNVCDDLFVESLQRGTFQAIVFDYNAVSPTAYAYLSSFALGFSGSSSRDEQTNEYSMNQHITGYNSEEYNNLMDAIYFIPYYSQMDPDPDPKLFNDPAKNPYFGFGLETYAEYRRVYRAITQVYSTYQMEPSEKAKDWEAQKAKLLHEAEKLLLNDMPVIPIVFNKNAVMQNSNLKNVKKNYYTPFLFTKTSLKNYKKYIYVFYKFPKYVDWSNYGLKEEPED